MQRLDYPEYVINVDRAKAADLGLTQDDIMKNVVAVDQLQHPVQQEELLDRPDTHNQYFVGVQYPEADIKSLDTLKNIPITSPQQPKPSRCATWPRRIDHGAAEVTHDNLQPAIDLTMGVYGRDLGHVADDVDHGHRRVRRGHRAAAIWHPYDPTGRGRPRRCWAGSKIELSGEYAQMQDTFTNLAIGLTLASLLMYFLMVALFKS